MPLFRGILTRGLSDKSYKLIPSLYPAAVSFLGFVYLLWFLMFLFGCLVLFCFGASDIFCYWGVFLLLLLLFGF